MTETIIDKKAFVKEVKAELKYLGYLQVDLARATYISLGRIKTILAGSESVTEQEITTINKVLGL